MFLYLKYEPHISLQVFLQDLLDVMEIKYKRINAYEIQLDETETRTEKLIKVLNKHKIEVIENREERMVFQIKTLIREAVISNNTLNISEFLAEKTGYSYGYLAKIFAESTQTTIESFFIFQRIERVKELAVNENMSLTEIAYETDYSSVAHLSRQFKKKTGINFKHFLRIMEERRKIKYSPLLNSNESC